MMRYQYDGYALFTAKLSDGVDDLTATLGVEHGGRLVEDNYLRLHGDNARYGDTLLLSAGQKVRRMEPELIHIDGLERIVHPLTNFRRFNA